MASTADITIIITNSKPDREMILTVTEPIWSLFISDIILLHVVYTLRMKSLEFNKSHAVKYYEYIAFNINLGRKHYYTGIINFVRLKWKKHLIVTNVYHYRNIKYSDICC